MDSQGRMVYLGLIFVFEFSINKKLDCLFLL